jgi:dienelactone hydrolase
VAVAAPTVLLWMILAQAPAQAPAVATESTTQAQAPAVLKPAAEVKAAFLKSLDRPKVPLDVKAEPTRSEDDARGLVVERLSIASESKADGTIERVPILLIRPSTEARGQRPVVIVLHGTGGTKEGMRPWLVDLARKGFVALAIDARYHGDRSGGARGSTAYVAAIARAWKAPKDQPSEHPFYFDTCWDLWRTLDYLETRGDVDPKRIGMLGISMGGIQTWLAGAVDNRVAVAVPAIGVQSFRWSLENNAWQGRANTIKAAHEEAAKDLGRERVDAEVCRKLWSKVIPGILDDFDCPSMIRLFAGRPLLILNGEKDPNCPISGARLAFAAAEKAYRDAGAEDRLRIDVALGVGHTVTPSQRSETLEWFERWLKPE